MRALLWTSLLSVLTLFPSYGNAGDGPLPQITVSESEKVKTTNLNEETYRGYILHLSQIAGRKDFAEIADALRRQLDLVEDAPLSPRVLTFFHTVPIVADELACLEKELPLVACFGPELPERSRHEPHDFTVWDSTKSQWTNSPLGAARSSSVRLYFAIHLASWARPFLFITDTHSDCV